MGEEESVTTTAAAASTTTGGGNNDNDVEAQLMKYLASTGRSRKKKSSSNNNQTTNNRIIMAEEEDVDESTNSNDNNNNGGGGSSDHNNHAGGNNNNSNNNNGTTTGGGSNGTNDNNVVQEQLMKNKMKIHKRFWDMVANDDDNDNNNSEGSVEESVNEKEDGERKKPSSSSSTHSSTRTTSPIPTSESSRKLARKILHELEDWEDEHFDNEDDTNRHKNIPFVFNIGGNRRNQEAMNLNDSFNIHDTENLGSFVNDSNNNDHDHENHDEGAGLLISERTEEKVFHTIERWSKIVTLTLVCILILVFSIDAIIGAINEEKILEIKKEENENEKDTTLSPTQQAPVVVPEAPAPSLPPSLPPSPPPVSTVTTNQPSISTVTTETSSSSPTGLPSTHPLDVIVTNPPTVPLPPPTSSPTITPPQDDIVTATSPPTTAMTTNTNSSSSSSLIRETLIGMLEGFFPSNKIPPTTSIQENALDWLIVDYVESSGVIYLPGSTDVDNSYRVLERFVLAVLYYESRGDTLWTDTNQQDLWMSSESVCNWKDIICNDDSSELYINKIELVQIGIRGTIPWELSTLFKLSTLSLKANSLTGQIPTEFGNFGSNGNLQHISLGTNSLTGSIPTELFDMTALTFLQLSYNHLTGVIPTDLAKLSALSYLNLVHNNLSGSIPAELNLLLESIPFCQLGQGNPNLDGVPENCQV